MHGTLFYIHKRFSSAVQSSIVSVLMPETPVRQTEAYTEWLFRASLRYETLLHGITFVAILQFCFDGTECSDYLACVLAAIRLLQMMGRARGWQRKTFEQWTTLQTGWITVGLVLSFITYHLDGSVLHNHSSYYREGHAICAVRNGEQFDLLWGQFTMLSIIFFSMTGLSMGFKFVNVSKRALVLLSIHTCQFCGMLLVAQAAPGKAWSTSEHWTRLLICTLWFLISLYASLGFSTFMVAQVWHKRFLQAQPPIINDVYCSAVSASSLGTGTGCGARDDNINCDLLEAGDECLESGNLDLDFSWDELLNQESVILPLSMLANASPVSDSNVPLPGTTRRKAACGAGDDNLESPTLAPESVSTSDEFEHTSDDSEASSACTMFDDSQSAFNEQENLDNDTERPPKMPRLQTALESKASTSHFEPGWQFAPQLFTSISDSMAMLHPSTGDIISSNPNFVSLAAQTGDAILGFADLCFIAKRLVLQLQMVLAATGQSYIEHNEVGARGLQLQGRLTYAGSNVVWIIHKYTVDHDHCTKHNAAVVDGLADVAHARALISALDEDSLKTIQSCGASTGVLLSAVQDHVQDIEGWMAAQHIQETTFKTWDEFKRDHAILKPVEYTFHRDSIQSQL